MGKNKYKRTWFFWIDKLQIPRKQRIAVFVLIVTATILLSVRYILAKKEVPIPENHAAIIEEFERKTLEMKQKEQELARKYLPRSVPETTEMLSPEPEKTKRPSPTIVRLNEATAEELVTLPGIGKTYAKRIIEYREANDGFDAVEELINVKGIGKKTLEKLRPLIEL